MRQSQLALFYLARKAEGTEAFKEFATSFIEHQPGCDFDLHIIYKGFDSQADFLDARNVFVDLPHNAIRVSDEGVDIGAYLYAAKQVDNEFVCFINTHSRILSHDWLLHLGNAVQSPGAGMAGVSASYESLRDSFALLNKAIWLADVARVPYDEKLATYFRFVLELHAAAWLHKTTDLPERSRRPRVRTIRGVADNFTNILRALVNVKPGLSSERNPEKSRANTYAALDARWGSFWSELMKTGQPYDFLQKHPRFPNPHIRSNGFIVRRDLLLKLYPDLAPTKHAALAFESGSDSLSASISQMGHDLLLVNRNGDTFRPAEWPRSETYRLGQQENLLMSDNQSRAFDNLSRAEKLTHMLVTWGEAVCDENAYALGTVFDSGKLSR
jgi:hypothetical protein